MDKKEPSETDPIVPKDAHGDKEELIHRDSFKLEEVSVLHCQEGR